MRIKLGIKAWATLSAMLLSVAVISGCNEDASNSPAPGAAGGAGAGKAPDAGKGPATPTTPPAPTKPEDKK